MSRMLISFNYAGYRGKFSSLVAAIGAAVGDSDQIRLQKRIAVSIVFFGILVELLLGITCLAGGEPTPGWLIIGNTVFLFVTLICFHLKPSYYLFFIWLWLLHILLASFIAPILLGGFSHSGDRKST